MKMFKQNLMVLGMVFLVTKASAFGVDVCYNDPSYGEGVIQNCIGVDDQCRTDNLTIPLQISCRGQALTDSLSGLSGSNAIIGGRSLVHSDSTYLMAQIIGFTPWQAYQMMIYDEATDQSEYTAFAQDGSQMLTNDEITACRDTWGAEVANQCLIITPFINGVYKFDFVTGGMLLHLHALFSPTGKPLPPLDYPTDYFSPENILNEVLLSNFQAWVFGERPDACAAGITQQIASRTSPCELSKYVINSPMNFFAPGFSQLAIPFYTTLGQLIINETDSGDVTVATDSSFQAYITPHDVAYAKMGVFLHTLADRFSHHLCTDHSIFFKESDGNYNSNYSSVSCAQGSHFLWHVWEQGTEQTDQNIDPEFQTMKPALEATYDQLIAYAAYKGITINQNINKAQLMTNLINVLQVLDPQTRLNNMVTLTESTYGKLPLPGHGAAAAYSIDTWLTLAGAPMH